MSPDAVTSIPERRGCEFQLLRELDGMMRSWSSTAARAHPQFSGGWVGGTTLGAPPTLFGVLSRAGSPGLAGSARRGRAARTWRGHGESSAETLRVTDVARKGSLRRT